MAGSLNISKETCDFVPVLILNEGTGDEVRYGNVFFFRNPSYVKFLDPDLTNVDIRNSKLIIMDAHEITGFAAFPIIIDWENWEVKTIKAISDAFDFDIVVNHGSSTSYPKHIDGIGISITER